jgi:hypothetical protein
MLRWPWRQCRRGHQGAGADPDPATSCDRVKMLALCWSGLGEPDRTEAAHGPRSFNLALGIKSAERVPWTCFEKVESSR